ncbi:hypothetical protein B0H15DRAFT_413126 [Mycena belliarum]|uniref:MYND-type domain-containing protein n=1 Tax=Mycena belliarum TaxID=1033014 RepID=A0AAD6XWS4_9AGAR|nr:hypothetical protein B0H15DRAFT_413126 [Mycena belliae]
MQQERLPPLPSRLGLACYKCFKEEDTSLSRCTGCHRVAYCSVECQKTDWKMHRPMCKALSAIENNPLAAATLFFSLPNEPTTDLNFLHNQTEAHGSNILNMCQLSLKRKATTAEQNLVAWEPRCMVCTRTDQLIRMEAAKNGAPSEPPARLVPCPQCNLSFCCPAHWPAARALHLRPCEDTPGAAARSHCALNREVRGDVLFAAAMAGAHHASGELLWAPERTERAWRSVARAGASWDEEFSADLRSSVPVPAERPMAPWIRAASDNLTMPMTILYALERLKDDDAWTRKHTLTVHILGAAVKEVQAAMVFEEILHRLPEVKTLKLVFCGPEVPGARVPKIIPMETCPDCAAHGRRRVHEYVADTYHGYVHNQGPKFAPPDLCIAFNPGAAQESAGTWPATRAVLVARKIPSVFTAYGREEADGEAALLRAAGAALLPGMGPGRNPWGSSKVIPAPNKVYGFYAVNGWLAGGFK